MFRRILGPPFCRGLPVRGLVASSSSRRPFSTGPKRFRRTRSVVIPGDPEKPKKPNTAYTRFLKDFMAQEKKRLLPELSKRASQTWASMDTMEREKYVLAYTREKEMYDSQHANYEQNRLKKPATAYIRFFSKRRKEIIQADPGSRASLSSTSANSSISLSRFHSSISSCFILSSLGGEEATTLMKMGSTVGREWRNLPPAEKAEFREAYLKDKAVYQAELEKRRAAE